MSPTAIGDLLIVQIYYAICALMLVVAVIAAKRGGILRLTHPLVWVAAATFFFGCGSDHVLMTLADSVGHNDSHTRTAHSVFVVLQVFGGLSFIFAVVPFVRKLLKLDASDELEAKVVLERAAAAARDRVDADAEVAEGKLRADKRETDGRPRHE